MLLRRGIRTVVSGHLGLALVLAGGALASENGVIVESVDPGGAALAAGLRPGDRLLSWVRAAPAPGGGTGHDVNPPTPPPPREGAFASPVDVLDVEIEQAPLGRITLICERSGEARSVDLPPGSWGLRVRPKLTGAVLDGYQLAAREKEGGELQRAVTRLRDLAASPGMESTQGVWLVSRAAEWLAGGGRWEEALSLFDRAAASAGAETGSRLVAALRYREGDLCEKASRFEEGARSYRASLETWQRLSPGSLSVAEGLYRIGRVAFQRGDLQAAEDRYREALEIRKRLAPGSLEMAEVLNALGNTVRRRLGPGDLEQAEALHREALRMQGAIAPAGLDVSETLNGLGDVAWRRDDLVSAEDYFRRALAIRERLVPESVAHAVALANLGNVAAARGDPETAERLQRQALAIRERQAPGSLGLATSLNNLGTVVWERGDLASAEDYFRRALEIRTRLAPGSDMVASTLNNLGVLAAERMDFSSAVQHYQQALEIKERLHPGSLRVASSLNNLGTLAMRRGEHLSAIGFFRRALEISERVVPDSLDVAWHLQNIAEADRARGALESAEKNYQRALAIHQRLAPDSITMAEALVGLGRVAGERADFTAAMKLHGEALAMRERLAPGSHSVAESYAAVARLQRRAGDLERALASFEKATLALEAQEGRFGGVEEDRTVFRSRYAETYREMIDLLVDLERPAEALYVVERSRAQGLLNVLAERDLVLARDIPEDLERERRRLAAQYDRVQEALGRLSGAKDADQVKKRLAELQDLRRRQSEVREEIRRRSPRLAALRYPVPVDLTGVRRALDPGTAILVYSVGHGWTHLFALDREGRLAVERLPVGEDSLRERVQDFRSAIVGSRGSHSLSDVQRRAEGLYDTLIAPVAGRLESADRVLIVPDGPLHSLPFAALMRPAAEGDRGRYVVEWKPIHLAASVTVYEQIQKMRSKESAARSSTLLAFGDPLYPRLGDGAASAPGDPVLRSLVAQGQSLRPLPATRAEVTAIAGLFGDQAKTFLGGEATEERARASGNGPRLIHFAAHGLIDPISPLDSAIVLSIPETIQYGRDNGLLQAWEVFESVRIDADLVTLSACETALGKEMVGEGILGLTRAFQYAGARSVLASLWGVADRSTADLMRRFYGYLKQGRPKDEALRAAQLDLIRDGGPPEPGADSSRGVKGLAKGKGASPGQAGPFHWAAFELFGDWR